MSDELHQLGYFRPRPVAGINSFLVAVVSTACFVVGIALPTYVIFVIGRYVHSDFNESDAVGFALIGLCQILWGGLWIFLILTIRPANPVKSLAPVAYRALLAGLITVVSLYLGIWVGRGWMTFATVLVQLAFPLMAADWILHTTGEAEVSFMPKRAMTPSAIQIRPIRRASLNLIRIHDDSVLRILDALSIGPVPFSNEHF